MLSSYDQHYHCILFKDVVLKYISLPVQSNMVKASYLHGDTRTAMGQAFEEQGPLANGQHQPLDMTGSHWRGLPVPRSPYIVTAWLHLSL